MWIARYEKTSYYHPEEGGYYQEGYAFDYASKYRHGSAKRKIRKMYEHLMKFTNKNGYIPGEGYPYITADGRECGVDGKYIGEGYFYRIESNRHVGKDYKGYEPYC